MYSSRYWNPGTESIDTFVCNEARENYYICPPISLVSRVFLHVKIAMHKKCSSVVFCFFLWPLLLSESGDTFNFFIKDIVELSTAKEYYETGTCISIFGKENLKFKMLALRIVFSQW